MQCFFLVHEISTGSKRGVNTMQAVVDFGTADKPEIATRHLQRKDGKWVGWNSDRARRGRAGIIKIHMESKAATKVAELRIVGLQAKLDALKGQRGVAEERKSISEALKTAKATASVAKSDLECAAEIAGKVDETHPEFVQFI